MIGSGGYLVSEWHDWDHHTYFDSYFSQFEGFKVEWIVWIFLQYITSFLCTNFIVCVNANRPESVIYNTTVIRYGAITRNVSHFVHEGDTFTAQASPQYMGYMYLRFNFFRVLSVFFRLISCLIQSDVFIL